MIRHLPKYLWHNFFPDIENWFKIIFSSLLKVQIVSKKYKSLLSLIRIHNQSPPWSWDRTSIETGNFLTICANPDLSSDFILQCQINYRKSNCQLQSFARLCETDNCRKRIDRQRNQTHYLQITRNNVGGKGGIVAQSSCHTLQLVATNLQGLGVATILLLVTN